MKVCFKCKEEKYFKCFSEYARSRDGLSPYCKSCRSSIDIASYLKSKDRRDSIRLRNKAIRSYNSELLFRYKRFCGCKLCAENTPVALDLHHLDPNEKDFSPSAGVTMSTATLKKEIRKCVVLCANCHRKVHAGLLTL